MMYSYAGDTDAGSCKQRQHLLFSSSGNIPWTVQRTIKW